jgi:fructose-bisphosphate aldolase, class II
VTSRIPRAHIPETIRQRLGSDSSTCVVNGRHVFTKLAHDHLIVMACNPRITHVIPGIMKAAEELDAVIAFELTATEGGLTGGYTGQTPEQFVTTLLTHAEECRFSKPFFIHADHITITNTTTAELEQAAQLLAAQLRAGFTSFALDASFNPLAENIRIVSQLAQPIIAAGLGLEVELGEVKHVGAESNLTTVAETEEFLAGLATAAIQPQLLAIDNGSKSGNYLDGQMINIDLERTGEIFQVAQRFGLAGLVQHGITGTPLRLVGKLAEYGIRKGNIGTLWQNVAHAGLPLDLMDAMRGWARENRRDIKFATGVFKAEIDAIPTDNVSLIADMARREAVEFIKAFNAKGSASRLAAALHDSPCA